MTIPSGSRKLSTSSASLVRGASVSTPSAVSRSCHQPSDVSGTLKAVAVVMPAPCRPRGASGQGKNVIRLDGLPCSSP